MTQTLILRLYYMRLFRCSEKWGSPDPLFQPPHRLMVTPVVLVTVEEVDEVEVVDIEEEEEEEEDEVVNIEDDDDEEEEEKNIERVDVKDVLRAINRPSNFKEMAHQVASYLRLADGRNAVAVHEKMIR